MLSRIDEIIYPNRCEIIEFMNPQRFVYPIFKNGSSRLFDHAREQNLKVLINEQIKKVPVIDVLLRDPISRFISGFNTFVYNTKQENSNLDVNTIIYFAENYLFLNRHYAPQLSWLINIKRYMGIQSKFKFHDMSMLPTFTTSTNNPAEDKWLDDATIERLKNNIHIEMYIRLDSLIYQLVGKEMTFVDVMGYLHDQDPAAYSKIKCIALD
jgi:hypothetical protein